MTDAKISILSCIFNKRKLTGSFSTTMGFVEQKKKKANTSRKHEMNKYSISIFFPSHHFLHIGEWKTKKS